MFSLSKKTKGYFVDLNDQAALMARTSSPLAPMVIEEIKEVPVTDEASLESAFKDFTEKKAGGGYMHASCGIYPAKRVVRRVTLDIKRVKESGYLGEICTQQLRIEADKFTLSVLHAHDGADYEIGKVTTQKEVLFVGGQNDELLSFQERLLTLGVFPNRLELGTVAMLGALVDYHAVTQLKAPTLVLEMDADSTQSFIVSAGGVDVSRSVPQGLDAMVPVVQKELNLKDEESAKKLFFSNTFDFTNMGGALVKKLLKELQSLIGFYEVQTGQSIGQVMCTQLPRKLSWLGGSVAKELGVDLFKPDFPAWLSSHEITFANPADAADLDSRSVGLFGLMVYYDVVAPTKK
jgi:hypothetical protein